MTRKSKATGAVYRDEAADLMAAAARREQFEPGPAAFSRRAEAPPVFPEEPLSYPSPVGLNDNTDYDEPPREVRQFSMPRLIAWIVISPWYLAVAAASIGVDILFAKSLLGL